MKTTQITTAIESLPADLRADAERSLLVPQFGPYHNEGPFMDSHLGLVFSTLADVANGNFHPEVPEAVRPQMQKAATLFAHLVPVYVVLHDLDKGNCMTLVSADGSKKAVSWNEWTLMLGENDVEAGDADGIARFCRTQGITQISYYQQMPDGSRSHGKVAAERLSGRSDIDGLVVKAIETHEVAFQFGAKGGVNMPLYEKTFGEWSDDEVAFALLVNYADQMGSISESGSPDVSDFILLAKTHVAIGQFAELKVRIAETPKLEAGKVQKAMDALRKATDAFSNEDVDDALQRIIAECTIPTYDEGKLRKEIEPLVAGGTLDNGTAEKLIAALVATGQVPSDIGKRLGKANKPVRDAIARAK